MMQGRTGLMAAAALVRETCMVALLAIGSMACAAEAPPVLPNLLTDTTGEVPIQTRREYAKLFTTCPSHAALALLKKANGSVQRIEDANFELVNLDDYAFDILSLPRRPSLDGTPAAATEPVETAEGLVDFFRVNWAKLMPPEIVRSLKGFDEESAKAWATRATAVGSIQEFTIAAKVVPLPGPLSPEFYEKFVVVTLAADRFSWRVATAKIGFADPGGHPLSGVREWGLRTTAGGTLQFYTRAVDRVTGILEGTSFMAKKVVAGADTTWLGFMNNVKVAIERDGGLTSPLKKTVRSIDWKASFSDAGIPVGNCTGPAEATANTSRTQIAVAAQLLAKSDPSGTLHALAGKSLAQLSAAKTAPEREEILTATRAVAKQIKSADTPAALLSIVNSPQGRRFGLSTFAKAWQEGAGRFVPTSILGAEEVAANATPTMADLPRLVMATSDAATKRDLGAWLGAINGTQKISSAELTASLVPQDQRALVETTVRVLANPKSVSSLEGLTGILVQSAGAEVVNKVQEIKAVQQRAANAAAAVTQLRNFAPGDLADRGQRTKTVAAIADLASLAGTLVGDQKLGGKVQTAVKQAQAAMEVAEAASILATVGSGGTAMAAMAALSSLGVLSTPDPGAQQTQAIFDAIADLTALVKEEFQRVNSKLDAMAAQLDEVSGSLKRQEAMLAQTLASLQETRRQISWIQVSLGWAVQSLQASVSDNFDVDCRNIRLGRTSMPTAKKAAKERFFNCLGLYRVRAVATGLETPEGDLPTQILTSLGPEAVVKPIAPFALYAPVARAATKYLGISGNEKVSYARLGGILQTIEGVTYYLDWVDRFGRDYLVGTINSNGAPQHSTIVIEDGLSDFSARLQLEEDFRAAHGIFTAAELANQVRGWVTAAADKSIFSKVESEAADRLRERLVSHTVLRLANGQMAAEGARRLEVTEAIPITDCNTGGHLTDFAPGVSWRPSDRLANYWRSFGTEDAQGPNTAKTTKGIVLNARKPALKVCAKDTVRDATAHGDGTVTGRFLNATIFISFAGASKSEDGGAVCSGRFYQEQKKGFFGWLGEKSFEDLLSDAVNSAVSACAWPKLAPDKSTANLRRLFEGYLSDRGQTDAYRLELLGQLHTVIAESTGEALRQDIEAAMTPLMARIAFLRGFLALMYPDAWATDDEMRRILQEDAAQQTPDGLLTWMRCVGSVANSINASATGPVSSLNDQDRALVNGCGASERFERPEPFYIGEFGSARLMQAAARLESHWAPHMARGSTSSRAWLRSRLQHFIESGGSSAYYDAVAPVRQHIPPAH